MIVTLLLVVGCSDYELKSVNPNNIGQDSGETELDTGSQLPTEEENDCTEVVSGFDIEEVSTLQDAVRGDRVHWNRDAVSLN